MIEEAKKSAAKKALEYVEAGMLVGVGSGSTAEYFAAYLGKEVQTGQLQVSAIATSSRTEDVLARYNVPLKKLTKGTTLDLYVDGTDEIDDAGNMVKGGGGALLREKIVASAATQHLIVADERKPVSVLGKTFPLPVDIVPFGHEYTIARLEKIVSATCKLRETEGTPFSTNDGNYVVDIHFSDGIKDVSALSSELNGIPGVVENGLFINLCSLLIIGKAGTTETKEFKKMDITR